MPLRTPSSRRGIGSPLPPGRCRLPPSPVPLDPAVRLGFRPAAAGSGSCQCRVSARSHSSSSSARRRVVRSSPRRLLVAFSSASSAGGRHTAAPYPSKRLVPARPCCQAPWEFLENLEILDVLGEARLVKVPPGCVCDCLSRNTVCSIILTRCVAPARGACTWPWPCWWRWRASRCAWPRRSETRGTRGPARRAAPPTAAAACPTRSSSCATASTTRTSRPTRRPRQRSTGRRPCSCRSATA